MEAIEAPLQQLVDGGPHRSSSRRRPSSRSDIIDKGMVMSGGGSLLRNIDKLLTQVTGVPVPCRREPAQLRRARDRDRPRALRLLQEVARPAGLTRGPGPIGATRLRRPPLPHPRQLRFAGDAAGRRRAAAARGLTHLAITDHDRIDGALRARDGAPADLTVIVGEEVKTRRRRPDLPVPRARRSRPACRRPRRSPRSASRAASSASRTRSTGSAARCSATPRLEALASAASTGSRPRTPGSSAAATQRAAEFAHEHGLPGVAVSDAHSILEVGVAYTPLDGDPSTPAGLLAALRSATSSSPGRASYVARVITPVAKVVQRARGQRPGEARRRRCRRERDRPMTDDPGTPPDLPPNRPSTTCGDYETMGELERLETLADRTADPDTDKADRRPGVARAPPPSAADDHLDRPAARPDRPLRPQPARASSSTSCRPTSGGPTGSCCWPRSSSSTSASRSAGCRWALPPPRDRLPAQGPRLDRDHLPRRGWSTASSRPSSATSTGPTCSRSTARSRVSRTFGTVFIERILDLFAIVVLGLAAGFVSFRNGPARRRSRSSSRIGVVVVVVLAVGLLHDAQLRAADHRPAAAAARGRRALRPVRGGRLLGGRPARSLPVLRRPDRPHLGDRGACGSTSSSRRSGSPTSTSGSAARSSSRSPGRC